MILSNSKERKACTPTHISGDGPVPLLTFLVTLFGRLASVRRARAHKGQVVTLLGRAAARATTEGGRPGRYALSPDPQAMAPYDGSPGGVTTPHVEKLPWFTPAVEEIFVTPEERAALEALPSVIEGADPVADAQVDRLVRWGFA
jgi:hypothetical protein